MDDHNDFGHTEVGADEVFRLVEKAEILHVYDNVSGTVFIQKDGNWVKLYKFKHSDLSEKFKSAMRTASADGDE